MYNRNPKEKKKEGMEAIDPNLSFRKIMKDVERFGNHSLFSLLLNYNFSVQS